LCVFVDLRRDGASPRARGARKDTSPENLVAFHRPACALSASTLEWKRYDDTQTAVCDLQFAKVWFDLPILVEAYRNYVSVLYLNTTLLQQHFINSLLY